MHQSTKLIWATPEADKHLGYIARVSNPNNQTNESIEGLFKYMMREGHVSPFEMAHACIEINTTRDIGRQILRHRSFSFQEFSQRYADVSLLPSVAPRECRLQDEKNRQSSLETDDQELKDFWTAAQKRVQGDALFLYEKALQKGIAKEQARALLPEGLTGSRMYMVGSFRSWIHYLNSRLHETTQKEHREVAQGVLEILREVAPTTFNTFFPKEQA
jgi:thymidylate synthase (FAD)